MIFGGKWYCYEVLDVTASPALIKDNQCEAVLGSGYAPIKISETREYGYLYDWVRLHLKYDFVHLGMVLQSGSTYAW